MKQKKLLLLGGLRYLLPVIKAAHELGLYVITCDNVPGNIAHKYSDESHNISIIDKEAVLKLAKRLNIDGVMSFAVDPGVLTAAYVANELGLPSVPYESVKILQNKALFRKFLFENNFTVPFTKSFSDININEDFSEFHFPIIVKPVDAAGSKGVTKVEEKSMLKAAVNKALQNSICGKYIIEEFIESKGYPSDSDCFSINNKMVFYSFSNQRFDGNSANPYAPAAFSWPSLISLKKREKLKRELQRIVELLNLGTSIYNVEVREGVDGKLYIMEMAPRGGGNRLAEVLRYATGVDLIKNAVKAAIGDNSLNVLQKNYNGYWAQVIIHSNKEGYFQKVEIDKNIKKYVVEVQLFVEKGEKVNAFNAANESLGTVILNFDSQKIMEKSMDEIENWLTVVIQ